MLERRQQGLLGWKKKKNFFLSMPGMGNTSLFNNDLLFHAPLTTSLFPTKAGNGTATFTRATTATVEDWEGIIRTVKSGEARFQGARRVENLLSSSENLAITWSRTASGMAVAPTATAAFALSPIGTMTATRMQFNVTGTTSSDFSRVQLINGTNVGGSVCSIWMKSNDGNTYTLGIRAATSGIIATVSVGPQWVRYSDFQAAGVGSRSCSVFLLGSTKVADDADILMWGGQLESTEGQTNTNPSDYVSTGVLSAPYHGANVDGVKYFDYENGNTVNNNVVTEAKGPPITVTGYLAEGARTNLCLWSEAFSNAVWTSAGLTGITDDATVAPDGLSAADLLTEDANSSQHQILQSITKAASAITYTESVWAKSNGRDLVFVATNAAGTSNAIARFVLSGSGSTASVSGSGFTDVSATIEAYVNGWYRCTMTYTTDTDTTLNIRKRLSNGGTSSYQGDGVSGVYLWGAGLEANTFASSYIKTEASTVTRNADVLTYPFTGNADAAIGTAYAELWTEWATNANAPCAVIFAGGGLSRGPLSVNNAAATTIRIIDSAANSAVKSGLTDMSTAVRKRASSWGSGMSITGDGEAPQTATFSGDMTSSAIRIGIDSSGSNILAWFGTIRNVRIWSRQFTDAQLQAITT